MTMSEQQLRELRECIAQVRGRPPRVTVLGDFMLDGWWVGMIHRYAREAPAPVIEVSDRVDAPGGAANTALNLASLGAQVRAVGAVGVDAAATRLRRHLEHVGVDSTLLREVPGARTTTKVRVSVQGEMLIRIDDEQPDNWPSSAREQLIADVADGITDCDALLVCDYGSALLNDALISAIARLPRAPLVVVDSHEPCRWRALRPDLITPNAEETERSQLHPLGEGAGRVQRLEAGVLFERTGAHAIVVTLDHSGTVTLRNGQQAHRTHTVPAPEHQASGAGDVFVAALTTAHAAGVTLERAADFAQTAADTAVRKPGTCVCSLEELQQLGVARHVPPSSPGAARRLPRPHAVPLQVRVRDDAAGHPAATGPHHRISNYGASEREGSDPSR